ncbi:hypothetical protein OSB04_un000512 [Centaurea solstitialis]|uniref:Uncharacterized protein n=1 Tax=Centaurea solstitialis TaxID=347529 RepID=A0AA38SQC5_9ASTR|nr:hypothetical protein OSB04_un000512 [Centaurea solstitialis]
MAGTKNAKRATGFLGLTGYYRKFVKDYGKIARPLTEQLKKDNFRWNEEASRAFQQLKTVMTQVPVLALPDFGKTFVVETDASGFGVGAVLLQDGRPIAYFSQVLGTRARLKSVYERELMAIVFAIQKWRLYLLGRKFVVRTDQRSLKYLLQQRVVAEDHQNWLSKLLGYNFDIEYRPGRENNVADALSRKTITELAAIETGCNIDWGKLWQEIDNDTELADLRHRVSTGEHVPAGYSMDNNRLLFKGRLVLNRNSTWVPKLFHEFHGSTLGGHSGVQKTYRRMARELFWIGMKGDISKMVSQCDICQRQKYSTMAPSGLLQPLELPNKVWSEITMDFITGLPKSEGYSVIFVVVDRLSKYGHFVPLKHPYTALTVAEVFLREVVRLHGILESIVSDRDRVFLSLFWRELFRLQDSPKKWAKWLSWAEFWYNSSFHTSTNTTPFRILYGRDSPHLVYYGSQRTSLGTVEEYLEERDVVLRDLKEYLMRAQQLMKANADKRRKDEEFTVGERLFLKLQPYRQHSVARRVNEKLSPRYFGPFEVLKRIGRVAYRLKLPDSSKIHDVFHVSQLKKAIGNHLALPSLPATLTADMEVLLQPERVEGVREGTSGREVLIRWKDLPTYEATWERFEDMVQQFPDFHLEDKVNVWEGNGKHLERLVKNKNKKQHNRSTFTEPSS